MNKKVASLNIYLADCSRTERQKGGGSGTRTHPPTDNCNLQHSRPSKKLTAILYFDPPHAPDEPNAKSSPTRPCCAWIGVEFVGFTNLASSAVRWVAYPGMPKQRRVGGQLGQVFMGFLLRQLRIPLQALRDGKTDGNNYTPLLGKDAPFPQGTG